MCRTLQCSHSVADPGCGQDWTPENFCETLPGDASQYQPKLIYIAAGTLQNIYFNTEDSGHFYKCNIYYASAIVINDIGNSWILSYVILSMDYCYMLDVFYTEIRINYYHYYYYNIPFLNIIYSFGYVCSKYEGQWKLSLSLCDVPFISCHHYSEKKIVNLTWPRKKLMWPRNLI